MALGGLATDDSRTQCQRSRWISLRNYSLRSASSVGNNDEDSHTGTNPYPCKSVQTHREEKEWRSEISLGRSLQGRTMEMKILILLLSQSTSRPASQPSLSSPAVPESSILGVCCFRCFVCLCEHSSFVLINVCLKRFSFLVRSHFILLHEESHNRGICGSCWRLNWTHSSTIGAASNRKVYVDLLCWICLVCCLNRIHFDRITQGATMLHVCMNWVAGGGKG